jgi:AraC-like DNA-binding protein
VARVFVNLLKDAEQELGRIDRSAHDALAQTMMSLLRAALLERAALAGATRGTDLLYDRAMTYLSTHMSDPELSLEQVARALGCSKRYLHQAFHHTGCTPAQTLLRLRLERCRVALQHPHHLHLPVASIALSAGFRDAAHFGRLFRQCYGLTPGAWRRQAETA